MELIVEREFTAPGPGTWELDTTHSHAAMTLYSSECFDGLRRGVKEGFARYGIMASHLQPHFVNGFSYNQLVGLLGKPGSALPPKYVFKLVSKIHPLLRQRVKTAHAAFTGRLWLQDLQDWDELKKDSILRNSGLQSVDVSQLGDESLVTHLRDCRENAEEMVYRHHIYTVSSTLPVGWFLDVATRSSGFSVAEIVPLLKGSTPISMGLGGSELERVARAILAAGIDRQTLQAQRAEQALAELRSIPSIGAAIDAYLALAGCMLIGGYCISEKTLHESPNIIMARIFDALEALDTQGAKDYDEELVQRIRAQIAVEDRDEFDCALADARVVNRMRDERGVFNDIWAAGISRRAILEAGRRLVARGVLTDPELLIDASSEEMRGLLCGEDAVSEEELQRRRQWRMHKNIDDIPRYLGTPPMPPPPLDWLPPKVHATMRAFSIVMGNVFDAPEEASEERIAGLPVSPGVYEGIAKVILSTRDFGRLNQGDVLVTKNTSAGFNAVLPIIGALVTDRGGVLSHAAIVSREYGIPGVVSTKTATQLIPDGARVRVDGNTGEVILLT